MLSSLLLKNVFLLVVGMLEVGQNYEGSAHLSPSIPLLSLNRAGIVRYLQLGQQKAFTKLLDASSQTCEI